MWPMKAFWTLIGQKLSSRKFWVVVAGYLIAAISHQLSASDKTLIYTTLGPIWMAIEGYIDAKAIKPPTPPAP